MTTVIHTAGMEGIDWFDRTTQLNATTIPPFTLQSLDQWRDWADNACRANSDLPPPEDFPTWREWADRFNQIVGSA